MIAAVIDAYGKTGGNKSEAGRLLKIDRATVDKYLRRAAELGMLGTNPVLPGYAIKSTSVQQGPDGEVQKQWIRQSKEPGPEFSLPDGHVIKGVSALTDSGGRVIQQWVKTKFDEAIVDIKQSLTETFKAYKGHATLPKPPKHTDSDIANVYPISDHHLGLYAWAEEAGEDYDLHIGEKLLMDTMASLVADAAPAKTGVILGLGDFFHSDDNSNRTRKSGNQLDVDSRYAKILRVGVSLAIHCVQMGLQKHDKIILRFLPGNHDPYASIALSTALAAFFVNNKRVFVDTDASAFFWWRFGKVFIGSTHGDMIKHMEMPGVMASMRPKDWGETEFRYIYLGHVHHKSLGGGERAGVIWETFQTLAPKDVWHNQSGYTSGRSMVAITHHKDKGEIKRNTVSVKGPS